MAEEKKSVVYSLLFPNGKRYIGMSTNVKDRCRPSHYRTQKVFNQIVMYGWKNIKIEVLADNLSREKAKEKEIEFIKYFKTTNIRYGYNEDLGVKHSDNHILSSTKNRRSYIGEQNPFYGKHLNEEAKKKIVENRRDYHLGNNPKAKKIYCYNNDKIYSSIKEASLELNISEPMIIGVIKGKYTSTKGYYFEECS